MPNRFTGPVPLADRIRNRSAEDASGCWIWQGALNDSGYGTLRLPDHRLLRAHRVSYEVFVGPIPDGMDLDHLCRVRSCVNPAHLEPVTRGTNLARGARGFALTGYCRSGRHRVAETGIYTSNGRRTCAACKRERHRRYTANG